MKSATFEKWLQEHFSRLHPEVLDDDGPDAFDNWLSELDSEEIVALGELAIKELSK